MGSFSEGITVLCSPAGELLTLFWRGACYTVEPHPLCWYERRSWWENESRIRPGEGMGVVDLQMWRLQLRRVGTAECVSLDVVHYQPNGQWRVIKIYDAVDEVVKLEEWENGA